MKFDLAFVIAEVSVAGILLLLIIFKGGDARPGAELVPADALADRFRRPG